MEATLKDRFTELWRKHFNGADLPITFYYTDDGERAPLQTKDTPRCVIGVLGSIRQGNDMACSGETVGCPGGRRYLGFTDSLAPNFEYFLSHGIPGRMRGERYVKSPEMVKQILAQAPMLKAPGRYIVFKRWDRLQAQDNPDVVVFFATPDVLSGLFTLARFDDTARDAIATPFGAGCSSIVLHPYMEKDAANPRAIIGVFDPSARPYVPANTLSFAVPFAKFVRMVDNMEESFLITDSWTRIQKRIE